MNVSTAFFVKRDARIETQDDIWLDQISKSTEIHLMPFYHIIGRVQDHMPLTPEELMMIYLEYLKVCNFCHAITAPNRTAKCLFQKKLRVSNKKNCTHTFLLL